MNKRLRPDRFRISHCCRWLLAIAVGLSIQTIAIGQETDESGFVPIFDGKTLDNWDGNPKFWSVKDGAITGQTTPENKTAGNTFIIWRGGQVQDFDLRFDYKIIGHNSGMQYRSFELPNPKQKWVVGGYQADFEAKDTYSGILYGERFRGILALRGEKSEIVNENGKAKKKSIEQFGDTKEIQSKIKKEDWNSYRITAVGNHLTHYINGVKTAECIDNDVAARRRTGIVALQLHAGPPMIVQAKNIRLKRIPSKRRVLFIAGTRSHRYGAHEHKAGCMLLADALNKSDLDIETNVVTNGWPKDESVFNDIDSLVIYCDGGPRHPFNNHIKKLNQLSNRGVGIVCIHYGVEVPIGASGEAFLNWTGGYFETDWSVNPHWDADYKTLPKHPIANGVKPFKIRDEWYYHMRFRPEMDGVVPILSDLPPSGTLVKEDGSLARKDGAHSNNKHVRAAVLERKEPQHTAWARSRPDAGRGFGFTGGHFHWNWGNHQFRKLVLNAIAWTAHVEIPESGIESDALTVKDLMKNQDYDVPENFNPARIQKMMDEWNGTQVSNR